MKTQLRELSVNDKEEIYHLLQQIIAEENGYHNDAYGLSKEAFSQWLIQKHDHALGKNLPDGWVPSTEYWFYVDDVPVGNIRLRHTLNEALRQSGGHIGYAIAPAYRPRGYGKLMLKAMLKEAKERYSLTQVMISAHIDNVASRRIIESCGGQREKENANEVIYWIHL